MQAALEIRPLSEHLGLGLKTKAIHPELHIQAAIQEWKLHPSFRE
jgi:hypothetical protein